MSAQGRRASRFWAQVDRGAPDACWEWTARARGRGYGMFRLTSTSRVASHRFAFALAHPETEIEGMHVHHRCENRLCCNPAHLELLDPIEHAKRHADQRECPHGHAYDEANTILRPRSGGRVQRACRACAAESSRRYRQNKKVTAPDGGTDRASLIADVPTDCTCPAGTYNPGNVHEPYCDLSHPDSGITARTRDEWLERLHEGARQIQRYNRRDARAT